MKVRLLAILVLLTVAQSARAGLQVGAQVNVLDFFILPGGTSGLSTGTRFGLGAIYGGYSLGDVLAVRAFLSYDKTGSIKGSGTLFGQSASFDGTFKVFTFGGELIVDPPMFPLYFKAGIGIGKLNSSDFPAPFDKLGMKFAAHFGTGIAFNVGKKLRLHGGLDAVYLQLGKGTSGLNVKGFPYFRTIVGATINL